MYISAALFVVIIAVIAWIDMKKKEQFESEKKELEEKHRKELSDNYSKAANFFEIKIEGLKIDEIKFILQSDYYQAAKIYKILNDDDTQYKFWAEKSLEKRQQFLSEFTESDEEYTDLKSKYTKGLLLDWALRFISDFELSNNYDKDFFMSFIEETLNEVADLYTLTAEQEETTALTIIRKAIYNMFERGWCFQDERHTQLNKEGKAIYKLYTYILDIQVSRCYISEEMKKQFLCSIEKIINE